MLRHKNIDRICCMVLVCTLLLTCLYVGAAAGGLLEGVHAMGYEHRLFNQSTVHTIDIIIDDWEGFLETCTDEEYVSCTVVIDGERCSNVGLRAKGNTSLSSVASYGNNRYSFKIEFDHYQTGRTYYGLDKLSLNNLIQDKTFMKDYLAYTLMNKMGVAAPLCNFVQISVNGEAWGLYLAVEAIEDAFLIRNYGSDHGDLYKPDSLSFGGGRGNGRDFNMDKFSEQLDVESDFSRSDPVSFESFGTGTSSRPSTLPTELPSAAADSAEAEGIPPADDGSFRTERGGFSEAERSNDRIPSSVERFDLQNSNVSLDERNSFSRGDQSTGKMNMGSSDVMLQYTDDNPDSYPNIFSSAKTDVTEEDQTRLIESLKKLSDGTQIESAVDTEAVIRYLAVHNFMCNDDSYTGSMIHNYYLYEEDGLLSMLPWDYNLAFGAFSMGSSKNASDTVNSPIDSPVSSGDLSSRPILSWIFESEEYTALYHEVYAELLALIYDSRWLDDEIVRVSEMIAPYVEQDHTAFFTYDQFTSAIDTLREFCSLRCASIAGQLEGSIPATTEEQRTNTASLIDASHIDLSDLGEFGMNRGIKMPDNDMTMPDGGFSMPDGDMTMPDGGFSMPDNFNPASDSTSNPSENLLLLAGCAVLLIAAILTARFIKSGR